MISQPVSTRAATTPRLRPRLSASARTATRDARGSHRRVAAAALATSVAAAAAFALLARAVVRRPATFADLKLRRYVVGGRRDRSRRLAAADFPLGKWWSYVPASFAGAAYVARRRGGPRDAAALPAAAVAAATLGPLLDRWLDRRLAPPGRRSPMHPVFPSGHALGTSAVALSGAWVAVRAGLAPPRVALPAAVILPLTSGLARLHEDKHWVSDVVGGWLLGLAVAAGAAAVDEGLRR
jgi:undecaprenyl-diphosphatase